jgi:hypothetical protein
LSGWQPGGHPLFGKFDVPKSFIQTWESKKISMKTYVIHKKNIPPRLSMGGRHHKKHMWERKEDSSAK